MKFKTKCKFYGMFFTLLVHMSICLKFIIDIISGNPIVITMELFIPFSNILPVLLWVSICQDIKEADTKKN
jgi:hypothetical protein